MQDTTPVGAPCKPISRRLRYEVIRRDGHKCHYCGADASDAKLTVDHVIPRALGGSDDPANLVTACQPCNAGKSSTSPDEHVVGAVDERAAQWADALTRAAQIRAAQHDQIEAAVEEFDALWANWTYGKEKKPLTRDVGWEDSVARFLEAGIDIKSLGRLIPVAMRSQAVHDEKWKYFCGCVWKELGQRQELALTLVAQAATPTAPDPAADTTAYDQGYDDGWNDSTGIHEDRGHERGKIAGIELAMRRWQSVHPEDFGNPGDAPADLNSLIKKWGPG